MVERQAIAQTELVVSPVEVKPTNVVVLLMVIGATAMGTSLSVNVTAVSFHTTYVGFPVLDVDKLQFVDPAPWVTLSLHLEAVVSTAVGVENKNGVNQHPDG